MKKYNNIIEKEDLEEILFQLKKTFLSKEFKTHKDTLPFKKKIGRYDCMFIKNSNSFLALVGYEYESNNKEIIYNPHDSYIFKNDSITILPYCYQTKRPNEKEINSEKKILEMILKLQIECKEQSLILKQINRKRFNIYCDVPNDENKYILIQENIKFKNIAIN